MLGVSDVWWHRLLIALIGLVPIGWLCVRYAQLPAVWHGGKPPWMARSNRLFAVRPRSYVTYVCVASCYLGGTGAIFLGAAVDSTATGITGFFLWVATVPVLCVHATVNAFNRPAWPSHNLMRTSVRRMISPHVQKNQP